MARAFVPVALAVSMVVVACSGDDTTDTTDTTGTSVSPPTDTATGTTTGPSTDTTATPTTAPLTTSAPSTPPASATLPPTDECDPADILPVIDDTIERVRLAPGGAWEPADDANPFAERTNTAEEFAARLAFDCSARVQQQTAEGERLALIAWNDVRHAYVIQATDAPSTPYETTIRFQLFLEQPLGEWIEDQFIWAATMEGGESIIIGTEDYSAALTAKAWQSAVPRFEDLPVTIESERHGIDVLRAAGARNVSVAEPAPYGSSFGSIQFHTPDALSAVAGVAPADEFDPGVPIVDDETTTSTHDGVEIRASTGLEIGQYLIDVGFRCHDYGWRLTTGLGTPDEVVDFARRIIDSHDC